MLLDLEKLTLITEMVCVDYYYSYYSSGTTYERTNSTIPEVTIMNFALQDIALVKGLRANRNAPYFKNNLVSFENTSPKYGNGSIGQFFQLISVGKNVRKAALLKYERVSAKCSTL